MGDFGGAVYGGCVPPHVLSRFLTRSGAHGAIVLPTGMAPEYVVSAVQACSEPAHDLLRWLQDTNISQRIDLDLMARDFNEGWEQPLKVSRPSSSQASVWFRAGRAFRAVRDLQLPSASSASSAAARHGFYDARSLDRSLNRIFGVGTRLISSTIGWQWLMWRALRRTGVVQLAHERPTVRSIPFSSHPRRLSL